MESAPVAPVPLHKPPRPPVAVSFATDVEVIESVPVLSSWKDEPVSPDLLQPGRKFSIPTPLGDISHQDPAAITIAPPAYMLFPFADPFDEKEVFSTLRFPPLPAPLGFAPIGTTG